MVPINPTVQQVGQPRHATTLNSKSGEIGTTAARRATAGAAAPKPAAPRATCSRSEPLASRELLAMDGSRVRSHVTDIHLPYAVQPRADHAAQLGSSSAVRSSRDYSRPRSCGDRPIPLAKSDVSGEMVRADDWFRQLGQDQAGQCVGDRGIVRADDADRRMRLSRSAHARPLTGDEQVDRRRVCAALLPDGSGIIQIVVAAVVFLELPQRVSARAGRQLPMVSQSPK